MCDILGRSNTVTTTVLSRFCELRCADELVPRLAATYATITTSSPGQVQVVDDPVDPIVASLIKRSSLCDGEHHIANNMRKFRRWPRLGYIALLKGCPQLIAAGSLDLPVK